MHIQVTFWTVCGSFAVFAQPDSRAVVYTGRDFQRQLLFLALRALAAANSTEHFRNFARAMTARTHGSLLDITEYGTRHSDNLAAAATLVAFLHIVSWLDRSALAVLACVGDI